jgi:hypothetical protein
MSLQKLFGLLFFIGIACQQGKGDDQNPDGFETIPVTKPMIPGILDEASGMADSKANPGYVWVEQDSGNPAAIALLSHTGVVLKTIFIKPAVNRDWEDMTVADGPVAGTPCIYLADIGDNNRTALQYSIYRFAEPPATMDTVFACDNIIFQYPDGAHDAEALLVDNTTKDIYIITKQDMLSRVYKLPYPQNTTGINTAILTGSLSFNGVTGAAFSPGGNEILIRTYTSVYYWKRNAGQSIEQALGQHPVALSIQFEPQGEAICFKNDDTGFFTLSERPSIIAGVNLNFYKRK